MKAIVGVVLFLLGIFSIAWVGIWLGFIGGWCQIFDAIKATPTDGLGVLLGIVRLFLFDIVGFTGGIGFVVWGFCLIGDYCIARRLKTIRRMNFNNKINFKWF